MPIDTQKLLKYSGLFGVGLALLGGILYYRERKAAGKGLFGLGDSYRPGRFNEAPIVDSYDDGDMKTTLRESADMPIEERIASIQKLIEKSVMDPQMRKLAFDITKSCPERDGVCEAKKIYKWVKKNVKYQGDIAPIKMSNGKTEGIDLYQSARRTVELGAGDCDDMSVLISTLLAEVGIQSRLKVVAQAVDEDWSHIFPTALLPKFAPTYAVAVDATLPGSHKFGVEAPSVKLIEFDA